MHGIAEMFESLDNKQKRQNCYKIKSQHIFLKKTGAKIVPFY